MSPAELANPYSATDNPINKYHMDFNKNQNNDKEMKYDDNSNLVSSNKHKKSTMETVHDVACCCACCLECFECISCCI